MITSSTKPVSTGDLSELNEREDLFGRKSYVQILHNLWISISMISLLRVETDFGTAKCRSLSIL